MCKRAVETYRSEPSRNKRPQLYTQGPLDLVFGQHRAFPEPGSNRDLPVWNYLADVRKEAENDQVCHFVQRVDVTRKPMVEELPKPLVKKILREYIDSVMKVLSRRKEEYAQLIKASCEREENVSFNLGDLDFSVENDEEDGTERDEEPAGQEDEEEVEGEGEGEGEEEIVGIEDQKEKNKNALLHAAREESESSPDNISEDTSFLETFKNKEDDPTPLPEIPTSAAKWRELIFGTSPPPPKFFHEVLEHPTVIKLIVFYTKWLLATMPPTLQEWIFATFARLDNGLDHREAAIVRDLGRKAHKLRLKAVAANVPCHPTYDMVLAVVGEYYGQKDLLEM